MRWGGLRRVRQIEEKGSKTCDEESERWNENEVDGDMDVKSLGWGDNVQENYE